MSGGTLDYISYKLEDVIDNLKDKLIQEITDAEFEVETEIE